MKDTPCDIKLDCMENSDFNLFNSFNFHIAVLNHQGDIVFLNTAWKTFAQKNGGSFCPAGIADNYLDICKKALGSADKEAAQKAINGIQTVLNREKDEFEMEYKCHCSDEKRWFSMRITPIDINPGRVVVSHIKITIPMETERQLRQSSKMKAMGALTAGIAHDFNNILAGILGYTELVIEDLKETDASSLILEKLENIKTSGIRAKKLIKQILAFSRSDREDLVPLEITQLIKEVTKLIMVSLPSGIGIKMMLKSKHAVLADPTSIHQILLNLGMNAIDAMGNNTGQLSISTKDVLLSETDLPGNQRVPPGEFVQVSVQDTGKGIHENMMTKIIEPFFTTKPKGQGTGMGLSVVTAS